MSPLPFRRLRRTGSRRGSLIPAVAIAILVAGGCVALVLDRLWLGSVHRELQAAADAAALAAAGRLAEDDVLLATVDHSGRADSARQLAARVILSNTAGGQRVSLDPRRHADVRLGRIVYDAAGRPQFLETETSPTSVLVQAQCSRSRHNPVSLFFPHLTGQPTADVVALAEATLDNHVAGVRPTPIAPVPAWPLGILEFSSDPRTSDTWVRQIEQRQGGDRFRFDAADRRVIEEPDGLPEIILRADHHDSEGPTNACLLDVGTGLSESGLLRQFESGWNGQDCQPFGGQFALGSGVERELSAIATFGPAMTSMLERLIGQARIVVLYRELPSANGRYSGRALATRLAAARIMQVSSTKQRTEVVVQPAVIATRTALTAPAGPRGGNSPPATANPYIYRLSLSSQQTLRRTP